MNIDLNSVCIVLVQCPSADDGFLAYECDISCFYTCEQPEGLYTAVRRCCRECELWSQDVLTCLPNNEHPGCDVENTTKSGG